MFIKLAGLSIDFSFFFPFPPALYRICKYLCNIVPKQIKSEAKDVILMACCESIMYHNICRCQFPRCEKLQNCHARNNNQGSFEEACIVYLTIFYKLHICIAFLIKWNMKCCSAQAQCEKILNLLYVSLISLFEYEEHRWVD